MTDAEIRDTTAALLGAITQLGEGDPRRQQANKIELVRLSLKLLRCFLIDVHKLADAAEHVHVKTGDVHANARLDV